MKIYFRSIDEVISEVDLLKKAISNVNETKGAHIDLFALITIEELQDVISKAYGYERYSELVRNISDRSPQFSSLSKDEINDIRHYTMVWAQDLFYKKGFDKEYTIELVFRTYFALCITVPEELANKNNKER